MYENYIFDLYGTLVDIHTDESKPSLWKNMAQYMTLQGAPYQPVELRKAYGKYIDELRVTPETEVNLALSLRKLYTEKGITPTSEMIAHWALMFRTLSLKYVRLFDGAKEVLQELHRRKKKVYLLSNAQRLLPSGMIPMCFGTLIKPLFFLFYKYCQLHMRISIPKKESRKKGFLFSKSFHTATFHISAGFPPVSPEATMPLPHISVPPAAAPPAANMHNPHLFSLQYNQFSQTYLPSLSNKTTPRSPLRLPIP